MAEKEGLLPFKLIEDESGEALTSYSGVPLVVETCEALGLARLVEQHVRIKQRQRGVVAAQLSLLQRDLDHEAQGLTAKLLAGADEGVEVSSNWGSRQGGFACAHDVSENHRRTDRLPSGEKPVGGVFQRLRKRIVTLTAVSAQPAHAVGNRALCFKRVWIAIETL